MEKQIIGRGLLAGLVAGIFAAIFTRIFLTPITERAIEFEDGLSEAYEELSHAHDAAGAIGHSHDADDALFSRFEQINIGMPIALIAFCLAMGALLAVAYILVYNRIGAFSARGLAALVAAGMLVSLWIVPALKYPPSPPATSLDETIRERAFLYLLMVVISAVLFIGAIVFGHKMAEKFGAWNGTLLGAADYVVTVGIVMLLLPSIHEIPGPLRDDAGNIVFPGFPAEDLADYRLYALGTQVVIWVTLGVVFSAMMHRLLDNKERESLTA